MDFYIDLSDRKLPRINYYKDFSLSRTDFTRVLTGKLSWTRNLSHR